jgi:hypothetical protein
VGGRARCPSRRGPARRRPRRPAVRACHRRRATRRRAGRSLHFAAATRSEVLRDRILRQSTACPDGVRDQRSDGLRRRGRRSVSVEDVAREDALGQVVETLETVHAIGDYQLAGREQRVEHLFRRLPTPHRPLAVREGSPLAAEDPSGPRSRISPSTRSAKPGYRALASPCHGSLSRRCLRTHAKSGQSSAGRRHNACAQHSITRPSRRSLGTTPGG